MPTSKNSWMTHILGLERLFALQEPLMNENGNELDRALLELCRPLLILGAFFTQRPSVMNEPEWKVNTQPHTSNGNPNSSDLSFLMGILAELPALFVLCNECIRRTNMDSSSIPHTIVNVVWARVRQVQQKLQIWKEKWSDEHQNEVGQTLPINKIYSVPIMAWTTVFHFNNVEIAIVFTMFHSAVILLTSIPTSLLHVGLLGAPSTISSVSDRHVGSEYQSQLPNVETSVQSVCRSVEYYLQYLQPSQAPADFYLFFPMHIARRASIQLGYSSELGWLDDAFRMMNSKFPMGVWANMDFGTCFNGFGEGLFG